MLKRNWREMNFGITAAWFVFAVVGDNKKRRNDNPLLENILHCCSAGTLAQ